MKSWDVPVQWTVEGIVTVEANTLAEAIEIARDDAGVIPVPDDPDFVDNSWRVACEDVGWLRRWYNDNQKDEEAFGDG